MGLSSEQKVSYGLDLIRQGIKELPSIKLTNVIEELFDYLTLEEVSGEVCGKKYYDEDTILCYLLMKEYVFLTTRPYLCHGDKMPMTTVVSVNCNDLFVWGCADAEEITKGELPELFKMIREGSYGLEKWACKKRNTRPQQPIRELMKELGHWEDWMDNLEPNYDEKETI